MATQGRNLKKGAAMGYVGWIRLGWKNWYPVVEHEISEDICWDLVRAYARTIVEPYKDNETLVLNKGEHPLKPVD